MGLFKAAVSNYRTIIDSVSVYTTHLPPHARYRLATWLLFEIVIRKPACPPAGRQLTREAQAAIEAQVALFAGYMVIFAHDDAVDKYNLATGQIYDQLSRCLGMFLLGLFLDEETVTAGDLNREQQKWLGILREQLTGFPDILNELPALLALPPALEGSPPDEKISIEAMLLTHGYADLCQEWLNASIVSALGMGRAFRALSALLRRHLGEEERAQQSRYEFFIRILVQCMYAQAHSPEQKSWDAVRYGRFIELAYLKSTILIDLYNYVSDQVHEARFFATRHNAARACDQIFDDLKDCEEDTRDQVLGILHMHILEQGRLAEKFLSPPHEPASRLARVRELVGDTHILRTSYDGTFIYQNPFVRARRDPAGHPRLEPDEIETILREIWVNAPDELDWDLEKLAGHRAALADRFKAAWLAHNDPAVLDIIHRSNFPTALLTSLLRFTSQNKRVILESYARSGARRAGYVGYYAVTLGLNALRISFRLKRIFRSLGAPEISRSPLEGGTHGH